MNALMGLIIVVAALVAVTKTFQVWRRFVVMDYQKAIVHKDGVFERVLGAGAHRLWMRSRTIQIFDIRTRVLTVPGQEILSSDNMGLKVSAAVQYRVDRPEVLVKQTASMEEPMYLEAQLALRDLYSPLTVEEALGQRDKISAALFERVRAKMSGLGVAVESAGIKDVMLPGPVRQMFAQVVEARKAAEASLEKARGESSTLRHLANAARMLENNPALVTLKTLQMASEGKHTLVMGVPNTIIPVSENRREDDKPETKDS